MFKQLVISLVLLAYCCVSFVHKFNSFKLQVNDIVFCSHFQLTFQLQRHHVINKMATCRRLQLLSSADSTISLVNPIAQLEARRVKVEKEISNIKFVLLLMIEKEKSKITKHDLPEKYQKDLDILLLCELSKASLLKQLAQQKTTLADLEKSILLELKAVQATTPAGQFISVLLHKFISNCSAL